MCNGGLSGLVRMRCVALRRFLRGHELKCYSINQTKVKYEELIRTEVEI